MSTLTVSHGADFFGMDCHLLAAVVSLAGYAEGVLSYTERKPLVQLLRDPGEAGTIPPATATVLAQLLLRISRHRFVKPKPRALARSLADAAARAAADGEPWEWSVTA